jgi:hypothetical protein
LNYILYIRVTKSFYKRSAIYLLLGFASTHRPAHNVRTDGKSVHLIYTVSCCRWRPAHIFITHITPLHTMKLLYSILILRFLTLAIAKNVTNINIAIGHGIYLQEIPNVIAYQSSIPLLFTAPMPLTDFVKVFYEPDLCGKDKWICHSEKDYSSMDMIRSLDKQTMELQNEILQHIIMQEDHNINKRDLPSDIRDVFGEIGSFCCGLATVKTQKRLYNSNNNARHAIAENHSALSSQHTHILELTNNFKNITEKVNSDFSKINNQFTQFQAELRDSNEISSAATKFVVHAITHLSDKQF